MNVPRWTPRPLTTDEQQQAKSLFTREIPLITDGSFDDVTSERARIRSWMSQQGAPAPREDWLGVVDQGHVLGALHTSPHYGQADQVLRTLGQPEAGDPAWLSVYVTEVGSLEEVAVDPGYRRHGIASTLVRAGLTTLARQGVRAISGFACDAEAIDLFRALRFTIGGFHQPVPPAMAAGLKTIWWDRAPDLGRYFWKALPAPGAAFGLSRTS